MKYKATMQFVFKAMIVIACTIFSSSCNNMIAVTFGGFMPASKKENKRQNERGENAGNVTKLTTEEKQKRTEAFSKAEKMFDDVDYENAITHLNTVIKLDPTHIDAYRIRGLSKVDTGDEAGAVDDFTEAIKGYRKRGDTRTELDLLEERAAAYRALGRIREAEADEARVAEISATLPE